MNIIEKDSLESTLIEFPLSPFCLGIKLNASLKLSSINVFQVFLKLSCTGLTILCDGERNLTKQRSSFSISPRNILLLFVLVILIPSHCIHHLVGNGMDGINSIGINFGIVFQCGGNFLPSVVCLRYFCVHHKLYFRTIAVFTNR